MDSNPNKLANRIQMKISCLLNTVLHFLKERLFSSGGRPMTNQPTCQDFQRSYEVIEKILKTNILPFWYPQVIDSEYGGYRLNHGLDSVYRGKANKYLVTQARTLWFFSHLANRSFGQPENIEAARHGFQFLTENMRDKQFGGFYWEVDESGKRIIEKNKHIYGQAFILYALSEYAMATKDSLAYEYSRELFRLIEEHAHDKKNGGYFEFFMQDWRPTVKSMTTFLGSRSDFKLMNTHLHLMEAFTSYFLLTNDEMARERLIELIFIQSNASIQKSMGTCTDKYQCNWMPVVDQDFNRISYAHNLENVWLLMEAVNAVGISNYLLLDFYRSVISTVFRYGFDRVAGGYYDSGPCGSTADKREKIWWVQAEGLICNLMMYHFTRELTYYSCFCQVLDWVIKRQIDWKNGEWFAVISTTGHPIGDKAGAWKSPYHNGRAMIKCLDLLHQIMAEDKIVNESDHKS